MSSDIIASRRLLASSATNPSQSKRFDTCSREPVRNIPSKFLPNRTTGFKYVAQPIQILAQSHGRHQNVSYITRAAQPTQVCRSHWQWTGRHSHLQSRWCRGKACRESLIRMYLGQVCVHESKSFRRPYHRPTHHHTTQDQTESGSFSKDVTKPCDNKNRRHKAM